ncbi:MAG TPA: A/G-specific adenine glycosylase [Candidatus Methylomirabilis sp.]|nr:A/G-specific adenine glycosylase [Candidatus Methylomirabilis sp.]
MTDARVTKLLTWYAHHKRRLPWRSTRDPYKILVSEVMLQQTQVSRVIPFYTRWITRFPSWTSLARAKTVALIDAWTGLGYNRRALQLREAARRVITQGRVPMSVDAWRALPGVGPYTAAAVHAFSRHARVVAIDTNVRRVAGRVFLGVAYPTICDDPRLERTLERVVPNTDAVWMLPQAFMDLGAAVCTPTSPDCAACPLRNACRAAPKFLNGRAGTKPRTISTERRHANKRYPDRIYRGRILRAVRDRGTHGLRSLGATIDDTFVPRNDGRWLSAMIDRLVKDGLLEKTHDTLRIPRT